MNKTNIGYLLLSAALLAGCTSATPVTNSANAIDSNSAAETEDVIHVSDEGGGGASATSLWNVSAQTDPMTGKTVQTAAMQIEGQTFNIEATVKCVDGRSLSYQFSTFDKSGQPAEMVVAENRYFGPVIPYEKRIGDAAPRREFTSNIRYNNQISFFSGKDYTEEGSADRLTFRFFLKQGEETFVVDQTDTGLRSVLDACAEPSSKALGARSEENPQSEASSDTTPVEPTGPEQTGDTNSSGEAPAMQGQR